MNEEMGDYPFIRAFETLVREIRSTQDLQSTISYLIGVISSAKSSANHITLEITNPEFSSLVWKYSGAMKLLEEAGWIEESNHQLILVKNQENEIKQGSLQNFLIRNRMCVLPSPDDCAYIERFTALSLDQTWNGNRFQNLNI